MTSWGCVGNGSLRLYFHLLKTRLRASPEDIDDRLKPAIYITTERDVHKARIALLLLLEPLGEAFSGDFLAFDKIRILFRYRDDKRVPVPGDRLTVLRLRHRHAQRIEHHQFCRENKNRRGFNTGSRKEFRLMSGCKWRFRIQLYHTFPRLLFLIMALNQLSR
jgi:hypothetical protein